MVSRYILFILLLLTVDASAQRERRDSLLQIGYVMRERGNYIEAMRFFAEVGGDVGTLEEAQTRYEMGEMNRAIRLCKQLIEHESQCSDDANLIIARAREAQGYKRVATSKYKKLTRKGNAEALYYWALMLQRSGHNAKATEMLQKSIRANSANRNPHELLAEIMIDNGDRYRAILPLTYSLLLPDDTASLRRSAMQLEFLWRPKANLLKRIANSNLDKDEKSNAFARMMDSYIYHWTDTAKVRSSSIRTFTPILINKLKENQMMQMDWWQVVYADFLLSIEEAGHTEAFLYHITAALTPEETKSWIESHESEYASFLLWLEIVGGSR